MRHLSKPFFTDLEQGIRGHGFFYSFFLLTISFHKFQGFKNFSNKSFVILFFCQNLICLIGFQKLIIIRDSKVWSSWNHVASSSYSYLFSSIHNFLSIWPFCTALSNICAVGLVDTSFSHKLYKKLLSLASSHCSLQTK